MFNYLVKFDEPQRDTDGYGFYAASQVLSKYLEIIEA